MKIEIVSEQSKPLHERAELVARVTGSDVTPARQAVRAEIAKLKACAVDCIVIDAIRQRFGKHESLVHARVYASAEKAKAAERAYKFARGRPKEEKKA